MLPKWKIESLDDSSLSFAVGRHSQAHHRYLAQVFSKPTGDLFAKAGHSQQGLVGYAKRTVSLHIFKKVVGLFLKVVIRWRSHCYDL